MSSSPIATVLQGRLVPALEAWFTSMLEQVEGHTVYVAAIEHRAGREWRADLNTEEVLADHTAATDADDLGQAKERRWRPERWTVLNRYEEPRPDPLNEVASWIQRHIVSQQELSGDDDFARRSSQAVSAALASALGSPAVREVFRAHGQEPLLMVVDGEQPGNTAAVIRELNADGDDELVADALAFWEHAG